MNKIVVKQKLRVYYLIMMLFYFPTMILWGRSVFTEEKRIHEVPKTGQNVHGESSSFRIFLPVSS